MDLRYDGQQWPVRVALRRRLRCRRGAAGVRGRSISACSAISSPAAASASPRLRVVGRGLLDWTPPAARSPQAAPPKPREQRKVWIDPAHGWRDVPVYDGADLRAGLHGSTGRC